MKIQKIHNTNPIKRTAFTKVTYKNTKINSSSILLGMLGITLLGYSMYKFITQRTQTKTSKNILFTQQNNVKTKNNIIHDDIKPSLTTLNKEQKSEQIMYFI